MTVSRRRAAGIRAFEEDDIPQVARLWDAIFRPRSTISSPDTQDFLRRTLLSSPWSDPDLPSLVYVDQDRRIVGFLGAAVRRMTFDGRPIRAISSAHFMIDPTAHVLGAGALLLGRLLRGPQDLTTTDTASAETRTLWSGLGGSSSTLGSVWWLRICRTWPVVGRALARQLGEGNWLLRVPASPLKRLAGPALLRALRSTSPPRSNRVDVSSETLTPHTAAEHLPRVTASFRMRPLYDAPYQQTLLHDLDLFATGATVARLLHTREHSIGSYVYLLRPHAICPVLQVVSTEEDADAVLQNLFQDARARGAAAVAGRVEPHLWEALVRSGALFFASDTRRLIHAREPEVLNALHSGNALMTLLDGEWW
jgi:hypothetical protein